MGRVKKKRKATSPDLSRLATLAVPSRVSRPQPGRFHGAPPATAVRPPCAPPSEPPPAPPEAAPLCRSSPPRRLPRLSRRAALPRRRHRLRHVGGPAAAATTRPGCAGDCDFEGVPRRILISFKELPVF